MSEEKIEMYHITGHIPKVLRDKIKEAADANERSFNYMLIRVLENGVKILDKKEVKK